MNYTYNWSEDYVNHMYQAIGIYKPRQLNIETVSSRNGLAVIYGPRKSMIIDEVIFLDDRLSAAEQWEEFGHELCHALWHAGNQLTLPMPFRVYQEHKSINFAQYACVPSFMLRELELPKNEREAIWMIQEEFGVTREFAKKRLEQYIRNLRAS